MTTIRSSSRLQRVVTLGLTPFVALAVLVLTCGVARADTNSDPTAYPYKADAFGPGIADQWGFELRSCVSFVAWELSSHGVQRNGVPFTNQWGAARGDDNFGDAAHWATYAADLGYTVDRTPTVGSVAHWEANYSNTVEWNDATGHHSQSVTAGPQGHVAYVTAINADGTVNIAEYNWGDDHNYHERTLSIGLIRDFIHLETAVAPPPPPVTPGSPKVSAGADANNNQYVFWQGTDGGLWQKWYINGSWYGPANLNMGQLGSAPTVAVHPDGEQDVFWKGTDGGLWEAWWTGQWNGPINLAAGQLG